MKKPVLCLIWLLLTIGAYCQTKIIPHEGYINVTGGRIWYKIMGNGKGTPLLVLHGGPGSRSCADLNGYAKLGKDRPVILYDQLGSGFSDRPTELKLWNVERFVSEISNIRKALHLNQLNILGSSWGAAVVAEYMLTQHPQGISSVVFAGPLLSTPIWINDAKILLSKMPRQLQDTINKYEQLKNYNAPAYVAATDSFYVRYLARKKYPEAVPPACEGSKGFNVQVYNYMWGPTEFNCTGTLKSFDVTAQLHHINKPVLFIAGQYDEARPATMYKFQKLIKNSAIIIVPDAGHHKLQDNPDAYISALQRFLNTADKQRL